MNTAKSLTKKVYHTGGNAALMANQINNLGADVFLGGVVGKKAK